MKKWQILVEKGVTNTNCVASGPDGNVQKIQVLSSGKLLGNIVKRKDSYCFYIFQNWGINSDIFYGYNFRFIDNPSIFAKVVSFDAMNSVIELDRKTGLNLENHEFEIFSGEEAPILAARIVTVTPLNKNLPALDMRLGFVWDSNSLIEQEGLKTLLLVTKGYSQLVLKGNWGKNDLFKLKIQKNWTLFDRVIEVNECTGSNGKIIKPLSEHEINSVLRKVYQSGIKVIVIALMNSNINPLHEQIFKNLLITAGYRNVCLSHETEGPNSYLSLIQNSLIYGYLMPVISKLVENVRISLVNGSTLKFHHFSTEK